MRKLFMIIEFYALKSSRNNRFYNLIILLFRTTNVSMISKLQAIQKRKNTIESVISGLALPIDQKKPSISVTTKLSEEMRGMIDRNI